MKFHSSLKFSSRFILTRLLVMSMNACNQTTSRNPEKSSKTISRDPERILLWTTVASFCLAAVGGAGFIYFQYKRVYLPMQMRPYKYHQYHPNLPLTLGNVNKTLYIMQRLHNSFDGNNSKLCDFSNGNIGNETKGAGIPYAYDFYCGTLLPSINNIFFLETSCAVNPHIVFNDLNLTAKQACSIFSAAYHNPSRKVVLLHTCQVTPGFYEWTNDWVKVLMDLPNFFFGYVDLLDFYSNTSLLEFYREALAYSDYPTVHHSDILRLFILYLYGGTYMDMDVISLRSLDDLGKNFIGFETIDSVANGVMNFQPKHKFLKENLLKAILSYVPFIWTTVGPNLVTEMIKKCGNISKEELDGHSLLDLPSCNVTVLPVKTFYAVDGSSWPYFYNEDLWPTVKEMINESYATHFWNHLGALPLVVGSSQPLIKLAEQHCAGVYYVADEILS